MILTPLEIWITILVITIGTMITRFLPFIIFPESKEPPKIVMFLSDALPPAVIGLLTVYCLKNVEFTSAGAYGLREFIAIAIIVILHKLKNNVLLSIVGGTAVYMILLHLI